MEQTKPKSKKKKTKKKTFEFIIIDDETPKPKNTTLKTFSKGKCKKGTKKYKALGKKCYTQEEINKYKQTKFISRQQNPIEFEIIDEPEEVINHEKRIENVLKTNQKLKKSKKMSLKTPLEFEIMEENKRYNEEFIEFIH